MSGSETKWFGDHRAAEGKEVDSHNRKFVFEFDYLRSFLTVFCCCHEMHPAPFLLSEDPQITIKQQQHCLHYFRHKDKKDSFQPKLREGRFWIMST